tara:strand:- start:211 stop:1002 length:792 start_codon:yes stop_codon:yes gene_type:complete
MEGPHLITVYYLNMDNPQEVLDYLDDIPEFVNNISTTELKYIKDRGDGYYEKYELNHEKYRFNDISDPIYKVGTNAPPLEKNTQYLNMQPTLEKRNRLIYGNKEKLSNIVPYNLRTPKDRYIEYYPSIFIQEDEEINALEEGDETIKKGQLRRGLLDMNYPDDNDYLNMVRGAVFAGYVKQLVEDTYPYVHNFEDRITQNTVSLEGKLYVIKFLVVYPRTEKGGKKNLKKTFKHKRNKKSKKNKSKKNKSRKNKSKKGGRQSN